MPGTIRALIVDDEPFAREGIRLHLERHPDIEVIGEAADGAEAVTMARQLRPDVCLFDIRMPDMDGIEATRQLAGPDVDDPLAIELHHFELRTRILKGALGAQSTGWQARQGRKPDVAASTIDPCSRRKRATALL